MTACRKPKTDILVIPNGVEGMEKVAAHLQRAMDELDEAGFFFDSLDMGTQAEGIDAAQAKIEDVAEVMAVLLGRTDLVVDFTATPKGPGVKRASKRAKAA